MRRLLGGDGGVGVAVLVVESTKHVQDLGWLGHWLAKVAQGISELLQLGGVVGDAKVALVQVVVLRL
jgi:hypothetical protein